MRRQYNPALDGIRAAAVILVFLFHAGILPIGWIGVPVFFVLSGYLITTILLDAKDQPLPNFLKRFYWRRAMRIFPVYYAALAVAAVVFFTTDALPFFGSDWIYLVTYTQNFARFRPEDLQTFVHLWSLAVEEQFYLIWPFLVYFLPLPVFKRLLIALIVLVPLLRLGIGLVVEGESPEHVATIVYSFSIAHFDAFATGAALGAFNLTKWMARPYLVLGCGVGCTAAVGLGNAVVLFLQGGVDPLSLGFPHFMTDNFQYVYGYTALNIASAAFIFCCTSTNVVSNLFSLGAMVSLGKVSYGFYLFHDPMIRIAQHLYGRYNLIPVAVFASITTLILSYTSFYFLETPFLKLKDRVGQTPAPKLAAKSVST